VSHKKTPPAEGPGVRGYCGEMSGLGAHTGAELNQFPLHGCPRLREVPRPLRSFKKEHGTFCRLVIAPKPVDCASLPELQANRTAAAWRAVRAAVHGGKLADAHAIAWSMARYAAKFSLPRFDFDILDAERLAQDVAYFEQRAGGVRG
jgi:hypothetical protein